MEEDYKFKGENNPKIASRVDDEVIKYYKTKSDLEDPDEFEWFIKAVEKLVRNDPRYDNYVGALKGAGFTRDVFQAGIDSNRFAKTPIEMHHGPIFTLYDICSIVTDHLLNNGEKVSTFKVANIVLSEHEKNRIQVVMGLTETNHQLVHDGKMFVHMDQTIGDLMGFIKDFKNGFRKEHLFTLQEYMRLCQAYHATDNDYLVLRKAVDKIEDHMN